MTENNYRIEDNNKAEETISSEGSGQPVNEGQLRQERSEKVRVIIEQIWTTMPVVEDIAAAEQEILEEVEAVRYGKKACGD